MDGYALWLLALALPLLLLLRIYLVLPPVGQSIKRNPSEKCSLGVFLGSGGHTSEMRTLLRDVEFRRYSPRVYVYCPPDEISLQVVGELEVDTQNGKGFSIVPLPRARRVGEGLLSTAVSAARTILVAAWTVVLRPLLVNPARPWVDVLVINGPGTCVVLVLLSYVRRILGLRYTRIVYVESFARVSSLSLSGKLVRPFVDTFVVQWPDAAGRGSADLRTQSSPTDRPAVQARTRRNPVTWKGWLV